MLLLVWLWSLRWIVDHKYFTANALHKCFTARQTKPNFVPQAAKVPVQNVAEYYNLCYGLGALKGQLDPGKGECAANSLHWPPWKIEKSWNKTTAKKVSEVSGLYSQQNVRGFCCWFTTIIGCLYIAHKLCLRKSTLFICSLSEEQDFSHVADIEKILSTAFKQNLLFFLSN